jgi:hypothetical protein
MAASQTLLWQEVKHSYGSKSNTLMAASQTLLWQQDKHSYGSKSNLYWLSSFASIKCFIFHHFSQKPLKRLYDNTFDVLTDAVDI